MRGPRVSEVRFATLGVEEDRDRDHRAGGGGLGRRPMGVGGGGRLPAVGESIVLMISLVPIPILEA